MRETLSAADDWLTLRRFSWLLLALLAASFPQVLAGLQTFVHRDFGVFSYPLAFHFRECFWRGELPLWNPLNCCGTPFLAQWNTQVLYPPALFYLLLPLSWSLGVFCLLHLFWGGMGMFWLARQWTQNSLAAGFAGITFAFSGLMLSSLLWPSTVAGLAWMPWVIGLVERSWRQGGATVVHAALAGASQMLSGGVEAVLLTWVLLGALWLTEFFHGENPRCKMIHRAATVILLVAALSAAQLLPFFELLDHSRRQQAISAAAWPMPVTGWANFLVPLFHCASVQGVFVQHGQSWINSYYVGAATVVLALLAPWLARQQRRIWPLAGLAVVCLVLALGEATPVYSWLATHFNVVGLMRFPVKFAIVPVFVLPVLAAFVLAKKSTPPAGQSPWREPLLLGAGLLAAMAMLALTFYSPLPGSAAADRHEMLVNGFARIFFLAAILVVWLAAKKFIGNRQRGWQLLFLLLAWLDLFQQMPLPKTISRSIYMPHLREQRVPEPGTERALVPEPIADAFRHMALPDATADYLGRRYALAGNCNLLDDLATGNGFYPLYLSRYAVLAFSFYPNDAFSEPLLDFLGVAQVLAQENDRFVWQPRTTFLPLLTAGQRPHFADEVTALQRMTNADFDPRSEVLLPEAAQAWVTASNRVGAQLSEVQCTDQKISARLSAPEATVVTVAQIYYPAWRATVDGRPTRLWPANYAFQAFEVPAGHHRIELVYRDRRFLFGAALSLATLAGCSGYLLYRRKLRN